MTNDFDNVPGGEIIAYVDECIGPIQNIQRPYPLKNNIKAYMAEVRDNPEYKVLFTVGLYLHNMKECFICIPSNWTLPYYFLQTAANLSNLPYTPETLPYDILNIIIAKCTRKNSKFDLKEGVFLDKKDRLLSKLDWHEDIQGITIIDSSWGSGEQDQEDMDEEDVSLLTIVPVFENKKQLTSEWYDVHRHDSWSSYAFPMFSDIHLFEKMNTAMLECNLAEIKKLIEAGVNVNRGVFKKWKQSGIELVSDAYMDDLVIYTYVEHAIIVCNELEIVKLLVENGAEIPHDALASSLIGRRGESEEEDIKMVDYLLSQGCDINAIDSVGYTALNRAKASDYKSMIDYLISLGGVCK